MVKNRILAAAASIALAFSAFDGGVLVYGADASSSAITASEDFEKCTDAAVNFSVEYFKRSLNVEKNIMVSPFSLLYALSMTANGADGETLAQMEETFGMPIGALNEYLHSYMKDFSQEEGTKLKAANSIWLNNSRGYELNPDFLQTTEDYYGSSVFKKPFDANTQNAINSWVSDNTDGMIPSIIDTLSQDTVMYLINALAFDSKWQTPYMDSQVQDDIFTTEKQEERTVRMMYSDEEKYLEDSDAKGFMKYYEGGDYAFAALLPAPGVSVSDYASSLTGEKLTWILKNAQDTSVNVSIPVFTNEYSSEISGLLQDMGIVDAFHDSADFSRMVTHVENGLAIDHVLHKTYISVDEKGTKAAATSAVGIMEAAYIPSNEVYLNRPFVYMILDCRTNLPVFMGTVMDFYVYGN